MEKLTNIVQPKQLSQDRKVNPNRARIPKNYPASYYYNNQLIIGIQKSFIQGPFHPLYIFVHPVSPWTLIDHERGVSCLSITTRAKSLFLLDFSVYILERFTSNSAGSMPSLTNNLGSAWTTWSVGFYILLWTNSGHDTVTFGFDVVTRKQSTIVMYPWRRLCPTHLEVMDG